MLTLVPKISAVSAPETAKGTSRPAPTKAAPSDGVASKNPFGAAGTREDTLARAGLDLDAERMAFECSVLDRMGGHADVVLQRRRNGGYRDPLTQAAFNGWTLARGLGLQSTEVSAVSREQVVLPAWEDIRARQVHLPGAAP